jgi:hypothetical protein
MPLFANDFGLTSVRCRGLLVPHRSIPEVLARYVRPLLFENNDPTFQYSKRGSCCLLTFKEEYLAVFAEHQQRGYAPESIRIVQGFHGGPALAADTFIVVNPAGGEEIEDVRALRISPSHHSRDQLSDFYPLSEQALPPVESARLLIAIGTPTQTSRIDYDPAHIHVGTVPIACQYERPLLFAAGVHTVRINPSHSAFFRLNLDGMSGGPIFSIDGTTGSYAANWRGLILRGGNGRLHYIDRTLICRMIQKMKTAQRATCPLTHGNESAQRRRALPDANARLSERGKNKHSE